MTTIYAGEDHVVDVPLPFENVTANYSAIAGQVVYPTAPTAAVPAIPPSTPATPANPGGVLTKVGSAISAAIPSGSRVARFTIPAATTSTLTIAPNTAGELQIKLTRAATHPEGAGFSFLMFPLGQIVKPL
jgi:hypothetical protein